MAALLLLGLAGFFLLALWTHSAADPQGLMALWQAAAVHNSAGKAGVLVAYCLIGLLGLAAYWAPLMLLGLAWQSHHEGLEDLGWLQTVSGLGVLLASAGLLSLGWGDGMHYGGGSLGSLLAAVLLPSLNRTGAALALVAGPAGQCHGGHPPVLRGAHGPSGPGAAGRPGAWGGGGKRNCRRRPRTTPGGQPSDAGSSPRAGGEAEVPVLTPSVSTPPTPAPEAPGPKSRKAAPIPGAYTLPGLDLLDPSPPWNHQVQENAMLAQAQKLEDTLRHFGVEGRVTAIMTGPVVSRFEYEPALGVKISKITGLADDLALALKALSIRIVAPVPGKGVLGIEVPNPKRQVVALREILADARLPEVRLPPDPGPGQRHHGHLGGHRPGQDAPPAHRRGHRQRQERGPQRHDPEHPLQGHPGGGALPDGGPQAHRAVHVRGHPPPAPPGGVQPQGGHHGAALGRGGDGAPLRPALSDLSVRNIEGYNQKAKAKKTDPRIEEGILPRGLPYLVIVIDELADLMLVSSRDTEEYLIRLAQKARASGIHLIVATQRPSVDVITGLIKANFPTRISYQVSARTDSRVILDAMGAERLLGMGDLLFMPPGTSRLKRIHGPYVTDEEVTRVTELPEGPGGAGV